MSTEIPPSSSELSTKAQKQFDALGGAPAAIRPESSQPQLPPGREFNLVVCGTTKLYPDYWMFADTMGFIAELKAKGAAADCFSCFPAVEYFERVRQTNNMDEMKFGKHGDNKEALWIFSRGDFLKNEKNEAHWYQQVDPKDLLSKVQWWFGKVAESIQPNDVVNIFLSAHGEPDTGDMIFGDNWFTVEELLTHVAKFGDDVGVNIIVSSCHSGFVVEAFAKSNQRNRYVAACSGKDTRGFSMTRSPSDRLRCGRFANAFVESMGQHGLNLPSPEDWTLQKHHDYIKKQMRNITPDWPVEIIDPTFHTDHNLNTPLNQIIHRPESKHVTRLPIRQDEPATKWPKLNTIFGQQLSKQVKELIIPDGIVVASAEAIKVIKSEGSRCNIRLGYPPDLGVYEYLIHASPRWEFLLTNLYWRAFRQAAVWKLFCHLLRKGFVNLDTLTAPMDLFGNTEQIMLIFYGLACFPFVRKLRTESMLAGIPCQTSSWCTDTYWYARNNRGSYTDLTRTDSFSGFQSLSHATGLIYRICLVRLSSTAFLGN